MIRSSVLCFILFLSLDFANAQEIERIEINGKINVESTDKEGITVYNQSINEGVTTDENGVFNIKVAENDILVFGALQFKDFSIIIDERIIKSRQVSVRLIEEVNKLDEVIVLPYDLTGNINVDVEAVRTYNVEMSKIYKGQEDFDDYKFSADNKTKIDDPLLDENRFRNGLNFVNIAKAIFPKDKNKIISKSERNYVKRSKIYKRYDAQFLKDNFRIPTELSEAFVLYVEEEGYEERFLKKRNEMYLLNHLQKQSVRFLKLKKWQSKL